MDKNTILEIADRCLNERLARLPERPAPNDVRKLSQVSQQILFEVYSELRVKGAMGEAEDVLRNDNIKAAIATLAAADRQLARDILICAHAEIKELAE